MPDLGEAVTRILETMGHGKITAEEASGRLVDAGLTPAEADMTIEAFQAGRRGEYKFEFAPSDQPGLDLGMVWRWRGP